MDPNAIAGMAFTLILAAMVGGFILVYPLSRRLGQLLERKLHDKIGPPALPPAELESLQRTITSLESQIQRVGERQEFLEKLLSGKQSAALPPQGRVSEQYSIRRFDDADGFLGRALDWLLEAEAEHNLIVSIARRAAERPGHVSNAYYATIEASGDVIGCVLRTPPYKLVVSDFPPEAAPFVTADISQTYDDVPAVLGPEPSARAFADAWCAPRGLRPRLGMRQRVYQLQHVQPPNHTSGLLQVASAQHIDLITTWIEDFSAESGVPTARARALGEERIVRGELFVWEDDGVPCSMAAWSGNTPHGVRIGYVYTPPKLRGRGYASACVAEVSQRALDAGFHFCFLFTDLSNPVSNSIYQRIGYLPVSDVVDYWLT